MTPTISKPITTVDRTGGEISYHSQVVLETETHFLYIEHVAWLSAVSDSWRAVAEHWASLAPRVFGGNVQVRVVEKKSDEDIIEARREAKARKK